MQWIEAAFRSSPEDIDALCERLTALGAEGLVIEDEADFRRFLEQNRQYWTTWTRSWNRATAASPA